MTKRKRTKIRIPAASIVQIAGNGMIAGPDYHGVAVPILVLDTSDHPEIRRAIVASKEEPDGDVNSNWAMSGGNPLLVLQLVRPVPAHFAIEFKMPNEGILVDAILKAGRLHIKAGTSTSSFKSTFQDNSLVVGVPHGGFERSWTAIYEKALAQQYRSNGFGIAAARASAYDARQTIERFTSLRIPPAPPR